MKQETSNYKWVKCKKCGHKLFRISKNADVIFLESSSNDVFSKYDNLKIEIKCHSCKSINTIAYIP